METAVDLSRWRVPPHGVGYRRWVMVSTGLRLLLRTRFYKILLAVAWSGGLAVALLGFAFGQSVVEGGWLQRMADQFGPRAEALYAALGGLVALYPDVCVGGVFTLIFWLHSFVGAGLSLVAMTSMIPRLITRDRASNAITVYLARPLTTVDYLLGKLGMIGGMILLVWTGPLLFGWAFSMAFATNRDFVLYSLEPLGRALLFNGLGLVAIAAIALGVSALSKTSRNTTIIWIFLWLILGALASPPRGPIWIKRASFSHDLSEVRREVLRLDAAFADASGKLPLIDQRFVLNLSRAASKAQPRDTAGALGALGVFVALSSFAFFRKLRPE